MGRLNSLEKVNEKNSKWLTERARGNLSKIIWEESYIIWRIKSFAGKAWKIQKQNALLF